MLEKLREIPNKIPSAFGNENMAMVVYSCQALTIGITQASNTNFITLDGSEDYMVADMLFEQRWKVFQEKHISSTPPTKLPHKE